MRFSPTLIAAIFSALSCLSAASALAGEAVAEVSSHEGPSLMSRATSSIQTAMDDAMNLIGVRYARGGSSPDTGFDCSGFVVHVFREGMGLILPRTSREISKEGAVVKKSDLQPGDLVFFNTMRRTFSHVGIYLGEGQFIHSPRSGGKVRIENMRDAYWAKRYEGARRIGME
jgi:cell wall-associated NlpC family hydrolase